MSEPNPQQEKLVELPVGNVLVIAPAGCGKTEALAGRARAVLARGEVAAPQKILALTFSNKARDNLASRIRGAVGAAWRQRISVTNFHGLAARILRAHGEELDIPAGVALPEDAWRRRQRNQLGIDYRNGDAFDAALHEAKRGPYDDEEVMARLLASGHAAAIAYEERLREEGRLDYDDLIRHASRLLQVLEIRRLYRAHFGMVMVDEIQDLSLQQYEMVRAVGGDRVTYAGDPAQGIYSFAGADPLGVFARIRALAPEIVEFNRSYRSAPAVLRAVNALASQMEATQLECGEPDRWPDDGHVLSLERDDTGDEATSLLALIDEILENPTTTIGVVGRRGSRLDSLRRTADGRGVTFEDWSAATHVPAVVDLLNRSLPQLAGRGESDTDIVDLLESFCCNLVDPADVATLDELVNACDALRTMVAKGVSVADAVASCHASPRPDAAVAAGLHLLTGHKGKGQEFDWVFVVGLESGHIPDFRSVAGDALAEELRVLHVMVSRARYGVVLTYCRHTETRAGWRDTEPSPWLALLRGVATSFDHR
ncbi:MAG: ATP-dependent helicase [Actinomycetota bacterium]